MTVKKLFLVLLLLAAVSGIGLANGAPQLNVWTDKQQYNVGEIVEIFFQTDTSCIARITVYKPDGSSSMIVNEWMPAGLHVVSGQAGYPLGLRTVVFDCEVSAGIVSTQTQYWVVGSGGSGTGGQLPSLPPFPGIGSNDLTPGQVAISPNGNRTASLGSGFPVTVLGINKTGVTKVMLAEFQPSGMWHLYSLSGWYPSGQVTGNWGANMQGTFYVIAWADNNHSGSVEAGELSVPWLTVSVGPGGGAQPQGWSSCSWQAVGRMKSHQDQGDWCPAGSFLTQFDLDQDGALSAHDSPIVGRAKCCTFPGGQFANWGASSWQAVGRMKSHQDQGDWCPAGSFLTQFDLDQDGALSAHDSPIVGRAKCTRPSP